MIDGQAVRLSFSESSRRTSPLSKDRERSPYGYAAAAEYTPTGKLAFKILEYIDGVGELSWSDRVQFPSKAGLLRYCMLSNKQLSPFENEKKKEPRKPNLLKNVRKIDERRKYNTRSYRRIWLTGLMLKPYAISCNVWKLRLRKIRLRSLSSPSDGSIG